MKPADNATESPFGDLPREMYEVVVQFVMGLDANDDREQVDLKSATVRKSMRSILPFVIFMYAMLITIGVIANVSVIFHIAKNKFYKEPTYVFVLNNAISDIAKCLIVLPISLYVLVVQNWTLGELLCSFLPMLQDIPLHVTTIDYLLLTWDRFRMVRKPLRPRLLTFVCATGAWLTAFCLVLPYPIYIIYVDLGKYITGLEGVGICVINLTDNMQEYMRGVFILMYAIPLAMISYFHIKTSREIHTAASILMFENRHRGSRSRASSHSTTTDFRNSNGCDEMATIEDRVFQERHDSPVDELNVAKELRTERFVVLMVTLYGICLLPLMILRLARLQIAETYENTAHFDFTYTALVWLGFFPVCGNPIIYAFWHITEDDTKRWTECFRLNVKFPRPCHSSSIPPPPPPPAGFSSRRHPDSKNFAMSHFTQGPHSMCLEQES